MQEQITIGEILFAIITLGLLMLLLYLKAVSDSPRQKFKLNIKSRFIVVLAHYTGRFYRNIGCNILNSMDSLIRFIETIYGAEVADQIEKSLLYQQNRIVAEDFNRLFVRSLPHKLRLQILIILFKVAKHEKRTSSTVATVLFYISKELSISREVFEKTKATQFPSEKGEEKSNVSNFSESSKAIIDARKILNITENSSDKEIKKAYRKKAKQYHPDLNPDAQVGKFLELKTAYDLINLHRGLK